MGYGYIVAAPKIFHRIEPVGLVIEPDELGRMRGNDDACRTAIADYDADARAMIEFLKGDSVAPGKIGTIGFCIAGHLAFRAALQGEIWVTVCCYPTGLPSGKLSKGVADTIQRVSEIKGEVLIVFGTIDPHVLENDRKTIIEALDDAGVPHKILQYEADQTFRCDDGHRYDPDATDWAWAEITAFFGRAFG